MDFRCILALFKTCLIRQSGMYDACYWDTRNNFKLFNAGEYNNDKQKPNGHDGVQLTTTYYYYNGNTARLTRVVDASYLRASASSK